MNAKEKYRKLCDSEPSIPVFCAAWWMDAVCGEKHWDVLIVEKNNQIVGALPYFLAKGFLGRDQIIMPPLTQHNGIWIRYPQDQNYIRRLSYENKISHAIIDQLESLNIAYFSQHFHHSFTNWLPFLWKGFQQTTRYTYVIENLSDLDKVYEQFESVKRTNIRKAYKNLEVKYDLQPLSFYRYHQKILDSQGSKITYSFDLFNSLILKAYELEQGKTIYCVDKKNIIYGAIFIVWNEISAYYLISAFDPQLRSSGVTSLLAWEGIKLAASRTKQFDFEGSIVEAYERSYRGFGGIQKPYFNIRKTYSPSYMMQNGWGLFINGLKQHLKKHIKRT